MRERVERNEHAVVIVDSYGSRYYLPSLYILRELVLPAHTAGLNNFHKVAFPATIGEMLILLCHTSTVHLEDPPIKQSRMTGDGSKSST